MSVRMEGSAAIESPSGSSICSARVSRRQDTLSEPATCRDCLLSTTSVDRRGPPSLPRAEWYQWPEKLGPRLVARQRLARQGQPTLWYQRQCVQDALSPLLNRRLVAKSRGSEFFSAINEPVGFPTLSP